MIPLGSCTMKLNATAEMIPITWPEFAQVHPFAPREQLAGYWALNDQLCGWLSQATGYAGVSLQPNAGSQGEYAGLLAIRAWHASRGEAQPRHLPDPRIGARHQPGQRADGGPAGGGGEVRRDGQRRPGRPARQVRAAPRAAGRGDDHLPVDLRRVRGARQGAVRHRASIRRPRVRGRREHERAGRHRRAGRVRRRRQPPEPAQDLLHPARRRRPRRRPGVRGRGPGALPAGAARQRQAATRRWARYRRRRWAMPPCCRSAGCTCA